MLKSWGLVVDIELMGENKREIVDEAKGFCMRLYKIYIYMFETFCLFISSSSWGFYWDFFILTLVHFCPES